MSNWKDKCTFLNPQTAAVEIETSNGEKVKLYPVSVGKLFELRAIAQPFAASLMTLMTDTSNDLGVHRLQTEDAVEETVMPAGPEILDARKKHQDKALQDLMDALTSKENLEVVGGILIDSMRDIFDPKSPDNPPGIEIINGMSTNDLPVFIKGLMKANKGVLGDFGGKTTDLLEGVLGKVKARAESEMKNSKQEEQSERPNETGSSS